MNSQNTIFAALDCNKQRALEVAQATAKHPAIEGFKLNRSLAQELFRGSSDKWLLRALAKLDKPLWADIKAHDVPRTVAGIVKAYAESGLFGYLTVHASGGIKMMQAAVEAGGESLQIIAVTVLTSLDGDACQAIYGGTPEAKVQQFMQMVVTANVPCGVCSGKEVSVIRSQPALQVLWLFVPGITPTWKGVDQSDQARTVTPAQAFAAGATKIVLGGAIVDAEDPLQAVEMTAHEIEAITI